MVSKEYKEYRKKHYKEKSGVKVNCECGCIIAQKQLKRHQTSKKHQQLIINKTIEIFEELARLLKIAIEVFEKRFQDENMSPF